MIPGIAAPVDIGALRPWLDVEQDESLPRGLSRGTTPATQLARGMLQRGEQLVVVTFDPTLRQLRVLTGPRLRLLVAPFREHGRARDGLRQERRGVTAALRQEPPDVVHAHWTYELALGALASGLPTVVTVRDWAPTIFRLQPSPYRAVRLAMHVATIARARNLTVTSPYMHAQVQRWSRRPVRLIPNAIGDDAFLASARAQPPRADLLAVNNGFGPRKNVGTLLRAFALIRRDVPDARLRLVGYEYHPGGSAASWAQANGLGEGVDFLGERDNAAVHALLDESAVFVHPALEESFGLVLVEAMAHRVPVVAGDRSGAVPWVLDEGRAGVLVDVSRAEAIAQAVLSLLHDDARAERLGTAGYEHAREHFRVSRVVDRYLEVYAAARSEA